MVAILMNRLRFNLMVAAGIWLLAFPPGVWGQRVQRAGRPSERGPSQTLGEVGGANTLQRQVDQLRTRGAVNTDVSFRFDARRQSNRGTAASLSPRGFGLGGGGGTRLGVTTVRQSSRRMMGLMGTNPVLLQQATGYGAATSLAATPQSVREINRMRPARTPIATPPSRPTSFHRFFDINEAPEVREPGVGVNVTGQEAWVDQLRAASAERVQRVTDQAYEAFKQATNASQLQDVDYDTLTRSMSLLRGARSLEDESYLPPLLLANAALLRDQPSVAILNLGEAAARESGLFVDGPVVVAESFGDYNAQTGRSRLLTAVAQSYLQGAAPEETEAASGLLVVQAYCAWLADDQARFRQRMGALERLSELDTAEEAIFRALELAAP